MKKVIKTKDAKKGGYLVGKPHSEGGIKGINTDTGEPIEVEGGEVVITKPAVDSSKRYNFEGKEMTPKEILSKLNSDHGGVAFKDGGEVPKAKYGRGGTVYGGDEDLEAFRKYYLAKNFLVVSYDDFDLDIITVINVEYVDGEMIFQDPQNRTIKFSKSLFIGSFVYIKPYPNPNDKNRQLFGDEYFKNVIEKHGYNFYIPFQVKRFTGNSSSKVDGIILGRIIDGVYSEFELTKNFAHSDRVLLMPNPLVNLPPVFTNSEEIIYPENIPNVVEYADKIGQMGLRFNDNSKRDLTIYSLCTYYYQTDNDTHIVRENYDGSLYEGVKHVLLVNDEAELEFKEQQKFMEVESYQMDDNTYYSFVLKNPAQPVSIGEMKNSTLPAHRSLEVKILGFHSGNVGKVEEVYYRHLILEYGGKMYVTVPDSQDYGNDFYLRKIIKRGEPENRFIRKTYSELEKSIRQVKSKPQTNKSLYQKLLQITDAEISKYSVLRGIVDAGNIPRRNEIDRKLAQLQDDRDTFALKVDTGLELLDKFAALENQEKEDTAGGVTNNLAINGQPSELTDRQWHKVRTQNFMAWFGNWEKAYETSNYGNVSKAINERTGEPIVLYHGSRADFARWRFNQFPAAYFADNRSYSQWFANLYGEGTLYQVFLNIKNPIDMRIFGAEQRPLREYLDYMKDNYKIDYEDAYPKIKQYQAGGQEAVDGLLDTPLRFWEFIRHWNVDFLTYLRDKTFYDGIIMYENNPSDQINGQDNVTASYVVFRNDQIRWASANHFIGKVNDARFALGGKIEQRSQRDLLKNMDFVI